MIAGRYFDIFSKYLPAIIRRQQYRLIPPLASPPVFAKSFFGSGLSLWNKTIKNIEIQTMSMANFNRFICKNQNRPLTFTNTPRTTEIKLNKFMCKFSDLNNDRFTFDYSETDKCVCGMSETPMHYFFFFYLQSIYRYSV